MSPLSPSTPYNLTVPHSQNTAPVIKFRCLYTYDLRRKAKRWQDGFLRFHTFNKRIMVYDTPGNFIGDLHWRQGAEVQDGDEFELDKGAIVQVCESMEKTETDLSQLFEKKKPQGSPRPTLSAAQSPRPSTPLQPTMASQPSRSQPSLNHLLGIKRTPIARPAFGPDRAAKRQRVLPSEGHQPTRPEVPTTPPPVVIDMSESSAPPTDTTSAARRPSQSLSQSRRDSASKTPNTVIQPNTHPKHQPNQNEKHPVSSNGIPSTPHTLNNSQAGMPANTLRLSSEKPRRKLMYQALLPPKPPAKPLEPVQPGKRSNPLVPSKGTSQKVETIAPSHPLTSNEFMPSASTQCVLDEIVDLESFNKPSPKTATRASDIAGPSFNTPPPAPHRIQPSGPLPREIFPQKGLRKSLSDPTALTMATGIQTSRLPGPSAFGTLGEDKSDDQGPWTAEAMDLFSFWPPGRPKPS